MRILPSWLREFVDVPADDRQLAEALTSAGIAVESVQKENGETVYEMDLTTNRVDAMNHYGVAREASAIYDVELKKVEPQVVSHPFAKRRRKNGAPAPAFPHRHRRSARLRAIHGPHRSQCEDWPFAGA